MSFARTAFVALAFNVLFVYPLTASAQVNIDAYSEYFLVGQFGEVCTMCEVTVLCEVTDTLPEYEHVPDNGSFTLYHIQTRTFWSQVSTIWEWFVVNFSAESLAASGHTRPVHVYTVRDGQWLPMRVVEARLVLEPGVLEFGDTEIDRVSRRWFDAGSRQVLGYCQRLPLWPALEKIEEQSGDGPTR